MTKEELSTYVSDGFEKAKRGEALEVYTTVCPYFDRGELPTSRHYAFGWIIYYAMHQSPEQEIAARRQMLGRYLKLSLVKPHKLHSMILTEAIRLRREADDKFSLMKFLPLWNLANLRPGDWRRKEVDGKPVSSTVEKLITQYVNQAIATGQSLPEDFKAVFDKALHDFPAAPRLLRQKARLFEREGKRDEAAEIYRRIIPANQTTFYLWSDLARLKDRPEERKLQIALYQQALKHAGHEEFRGKIRIALAKAMAEAKAFPQALFELNAVRSLYLANGWHLSPTFLAAERLIPKDTVASDPSAIYRKLEPMALDYVLASITPVEMVQGYHKAGGPSRFGKGNSPDAWRVADAEGNKYWLTPSRFGIDSKLPIGTRLKVRILDGKVVAASL